jgi:hypothetical protein
MQRGTSFRNTDKTLTIHVPIMIRKWGGRKVVVAPGDAETWAAPRLRVDKTLVKALGRAHRWKGLLESGMFASTAELALAEKVNPSYIARVIRLSLLAPDIVDALLDGRQPRALQLPILLKPFPEDWGRQRECFGFAP